MNSRAPLLPCSPGNDSRCRHIRNGSVAGALLVTLLLGAVSSPARAQNAAPSEREITAHLAELRAADPEDRITALRAMQTTLDPRLPEALLPMLADEGNSIRRLAARGIGSRWWQIPEKRVPAYLAALQRNLKSGHEDEQVMISRALALLRRDYRSPALARSASGRWVIYERHNLPCLLDTKSGTEELLGWSPDDFAWFAPGNVPLGGDALWHQKKDRVALHVITSRKSSTVWLWQHPDGLRRFAFERVLKALSATDAVHSGDISSITPKSWQGDELRLEISFVTAKGETFMSHEATLSWNVAKDALRVISYEKRLD
jgi:hypothetical protein